MNSDDLLKQQVGLTQKIIERMDTMIDHMKKDLNLRETINNHDDVEVHYIPSGPREWVGSFNYADHFDFVNSIDAIQDEKARKLSYDFHLLAQDAIIKELKRENSKQLEEIKTLKGAYDQASDAIDRLRENRRMLIDRMVELRKELSAANRKLLSERMFRYAKR